MSKCSVCSESVNQSWTKVWTRLELDSGNNHLTITNICEMCASKIEGFLKTLGWRLT